MFIFRIPNLIQYLFWNRQWKGKDKKSVYLTFDDGPEGVTTSWVLDLLKKENIRATFFCLGSQIERHPPLLKEIIAQGHSVGNHTYNHEKGSTTNCKNYLSSIEKTDALVNTKLFRPPYGRITKRQTASLKKMGKKIIMWTWNSHDYDQRVNSKTIIKKARQIKGGDILLFHSNSKSSKTH